MYDPLMRVLTVLELLQARERVSGPELARRLEVSPRTVQRYIARLQDLGVPVEGKPGVGGAYRLRPGFRLPPLMFTDEEAFALSLGLRALRHLALGDFAPAAEGAVAKLARALPEAVRARLQDVEEAVALDTSPWSVPTHAEDVIEAAAAIRAQRRLSFAYRAHDGDLSRREIEPYGTVHLDGRWFLVGHCLLRKDLRTFRLDRVSELRQSEVGFERPKDFDAAAYLRRALAFAQATHEVSLWLEAPLSEMERRCVAWRVSLSEEAGGTRLRCSRNDLHHLAAMVLSLGYRITVEGPPALRQVFAAMAARAAAAAAGAEAGDARDGADGTALAKPAAAQGAGPMDPPLADRPPLPRPQSSARKP